ncbi:MAG: hypothetical protein ACQER9_01955 [Nanobdellota archaeon]
MENKIIFLGTAGDIKTAGKGLRMSGGIVLKTNDIFITINPGPDILSSAVQSEINLRESDVILCTDNLLVNSGGLEPLINYIALEGDDNHGVLISSSSVENGDNENVPRISKKTISFLERNINLSYSDKVEINNTEIIATKCHNEDKSAIGFILKNDEISIGFLPHSNFSRTIAKKFSGVDILICYSIFDEENKNYRMNIDECVDFVSEINPKLFVVTGLNKEPSQDHDLEIIRKIHQKAKVQVIVAKDGTSINASTYKKSKQTKLS